MKALQDVGTVWNITDWGNGEDEFLHTVSEQLAIPPENIFRFDLDGYKDRDWLLHFIKTSSGVSFEMLCELISQKPRSLLIFDNIASDGDLEPGKAPIEHDLEELASIVKNYSPESKIVLRGKPSNQNISLPHTTLRSLDEAEVLDYLRSHKSGGNEVANADNITRIWRYTGGSPPRIDTLLRELEVTSLDELISADQGVALTMNSASTPDALVGAVESLRQSEAPLHQRAFTLLEALSILPRGEKLSILKRFYGPTPLHPSHAIELFSRRLADTMTLPGAIVGDQSAPSKVLVSPKIVRDYVASLTADPRSDLLRSLALEMYFQDEWKSGEIKSSLAAKVCRNPLADPYQIANLTSLILTEIAKTIAAQDTDRLSQLTALSSSISKAMLDGNHYRHASLFCGQVLSEIQSYSDNRRIDVLKYLQGRALRMIGRRQEARNVFEEIELKNLSGSQRRSWNLEMAFIAEQEDQPEDAVRYAKVVLKKRGDGPALQAEQIIAEQIGDQDSRLKKLRALEKRARSLRLPIAANNLSLSIATETPDDSERESHLEKVMASGHSDKDFYNQTRAIIRLMDTQAISQDPKPQYIAKLAEAYQHLYNERSDRLFDKCHKALWNLFGKTQQAGNLFSLFRYSSFTWRLRGEEAKEAEYLDTLAQLMKAFSSEQRRMLSRELDYFRSRASRIGHQGAQENKSIPPPSAEQQ